MSLRGKQVAPQKTAAVALLRSAADEAAPPMLLPGFLADAIEYNRRDGRVKVEGAADGQAVCLSVTDTGVGAVRGQQPHRFEEIRRVKDRGTIGVARPGAGLPIRWKSAEQLDGRITLSSGVGGAQPSPRSCPAIVRSAVYPVSPATATGWRNRERP